MPRAEIDDTYAEAFRSLHAEVLITARDRRWLDEAVRAATGNASSTILCDCEAGLDRYVGPGGDESYPTPDGRPGAIVQFHLPRFCKDRDGALEAADRAAKAASQVPGVSLPFPGGVASSGSKAGSRYSFTIASTYAEYCPTLRDQLGDKSRLPAGVTSVQEIIINGRDLPTI